MEVFKAGKICYIDKPIGATLEDAIAIYEMAEKYNIPIFSSSALRFTPQNQKLRNSELGQILGADCYSPHKVEPTHPDFGFMESMELRLCIQSWVWDANPSIACLPTKGIL